MSLDLTVQEVDAIWLEAEQHYPPATSINRLETICTVPSQLGSGYHREMELYPGLELCIFNETYHDLTWRVPENRHLVQFKVHLSGVEDSGDYLLIDALHRQPLSGSLASPPVNIWAEKKLLKIRFWGDSAVSE